VTQGIIAQFCFEYTDNNRDKLSVYENAADLEKYLRRLGLVDQFIRYADSKGILRRNNMILKSQHLFEQAIYGSIIYNILEMSDYVQYLNRNDLALEKAIQLFKAKQTKPTLHDQKGTQGTDSGKKKAAYHRTAPIIQPKHRAQFA
jgi:carboxyl-terminal processing protease